MKTAVITGSCRGLRASAARRQAKDGYNIVINYVSHKTEAESLVSELAETGTKTLLVQADVSKENEISRN